MKPLATTQLMLTRFGLLQDKNLTSWQKFFYALFSFLCLAFIFIQITASAVFATEFLLINLERALYAVSQILIWSPIMYMSLVTVLLRRKITALIEDVIMMFKSSMYSF